MRNHRKRSQLKTIPLLFFILTPLTSGAATFTVNSTASFNSAQSQTKPGDTIIWTDGTYKDAAILINASGITVKSQTPGGVFLQGNPRIEINGDDDVFSGFQIKSGDAGNRDFILVKGDRNLVTQINIDGFNAKKYITISADSLRNEISYCNIANKPTKYYGAVIQISTKPSLIGYHRIHHCSFQNFPGPGGDAGNEPIRIGLSSEKNNISRSVVEYNYFTNVGKGDNETVSVKATENVIRYNTFSNNPDGMLVFRHGSKNVARGNFFINNSGGIRIKEGQNHLVYNNYFETGSGPQALYLVNHNADPLNNIVIIHNTFVNMGAILLGKGSYQPKNVLFANNIFQKASGNIFSNATGTETWQGNIFNGTTGITATPGLRKADPKLVKNAQGYFQIAADSPAINASSEAYPVLLDIPGTNEDSTISMDISGNPRPAQKSMKDVGASEYSATLGQVNRPLKLTDVGPVYLGGPNPENGGGGGGDIPEVPADVLPVADVVASIDDGINVARNSIDNNLATRWSANGDGATLTIDLGTVNFVSGVNIAWYKGDVRSARFDIALSTDGTTWTQVFTGSSSGTSLKLEQFKLPKTQARFVRYVGHGNSANLWNSITEWSVVGSPAV